MFENSLSPMSTSEAGSSLATPVAGAKAPSANGSKTGGGRVTHDSRGNAVWQWSVATGVFARIKSNELLNMLDDPTLALEGECELAGEWAGDPYNRR